MKSETEKKVIDECDKHYTVLQTVKQHYQKKPFGPLQNHTLGSAQQGCHTLTYELHRLS